MELKDIDLIEDGAETEYEYYEAVQRAINEGTAWKFQGSYGRTMMDAIRSGYCMLGRHDVQAGTKGSYDYVVHMQGQEWADSMGDLV